MSESEVALELKKEALKEELRRPKELQNKHKIERLQESIKRHKDIAISIKEGKKRKLMKKYHLGEKNKWQKNWKL